MLATTCFQPGRLPDDRTQYLWISLGNFIPKIAAAHSPGDGCQGLALAATDLIAQQSSDHRAYADANRTVLCNRRRCGLLIGRC
jgi:hypothetical protein